MDDKIAIIVWRCLLGEIYPAIRAIAVKYADETLTITYYLDRHPTPSDEESASVLATNIFAASGNLLFKEVVFDCQFSDLSFKDMDHMDGFVYCRREYDIDDVLPQ
ncbi:hypothetical protein [Ensifer aridi]|uniref:hypothetical protein n=1 Tax=Ensifer aridi TaxID=1708715 RepID=UPI000A0F869A|nr:hypothetical protein [Ensifer aridi]